VTQRQNSQASQTQNNQSGNQPRANARGADRPNPAQRMAQEEDRLKQRLADIDSERPSLEAFYNVLSPDQKMTFERAGMRGQDGMMRGRRFAFADPRGPRGPMGGPMNRPPLPPQGPGAPPPQDR
jgi:hypothetical protein